MFDPSTAFWVASIAAIGVLTMVVWIASRATRNTSGDRRLLGRTIGVIVGVFLAFIALGYVYFSTGGIILGM